MTIAKVYAAPGHTHAARSPNKNLRINKTRKIKNNILAIEAAPAAMPVKPNTAATIAMIKNITAHLSI